MPGHYKDLNKVDVDIRDFAPPQTPQAPNRAAMIEKQPGFYNNEFTQPKPQIGNINEDNTLAFIMAGGPVIKQGFNLSKNAPSVMRKIINKGKDFASTRIGRLVMKHADDVFNVVSSSGGLNK
tara:strand:- start:55 stop:423 length:369 start_codon:yes stop_codon:yes gene_type:complete